MACFHTPDVTCPECQGSGIRGYDYVHWRSPEIEEKLDKVICLLEKLVLFKELERE